MNQYLEEAWRDAEMRFLAFDKYVKDSDERAPIGDLHFATEQYSAWILLAYAAHESGISNYGRAALTLLAEHAATPDDLPAAIRDSHLKRTIAFANELSGTSLTRRKSTIDAEELLRRAYTESWASDSILMRLDRNAWPANVREWLERVGVRADQLQWMKEPFGASTDTIDSRVSELVEERNDLAHGVRPTSVRTADAMHAWSAALLEFSRRVVGALQVTLGETLKLPLAPIGQLAKEEFGANTAGIERLDVRLEIGGHLLGKDGSGRLHFARIVSIQHDGVGLDEAQPGAERISLTLNRSVAALELCAPL